MAARKAKYSHMRQLEREVMKWCGSITVMLSATQFDFEENAPEDRPSDSDGAQFYDKLVAFRYWVCGLWPSYP